MDSSLLRPPLPEGLSHTDIRFISPASGALSESTLVAIATALNQLLPRGDFSVSADGVVTAVSEAVPPSLWLQAGLVEGIERSVR